MCGVRVWSMHETKPMQAPQVCFHSASLFMLKLHSVLDVHDCTPGCVCELHNYLNEWLQCSTMTDEQTDVN